MPYTAELATRGSAVPGFFALFFIAAIPRRPNASDAVEYAISHLETTPKRPLPGATPPQMTRARSETTATTPLRPGLPPLGTGYKTHKTTLEHRRHVLERIDRPRNARTHDPAKFLIINMAVPLQVSFTHQRLHELVGGPRPQ